MLAGCVHPATSRGPVEVATSFVSEYSEWAQTGYSSPIPDSLLDCANEEMQTVLEDDRQWRVRGQVRHDGPTRVRDAELVESGVSRAVVAVTLDITDLMVLAEGEPTFMNDQKIHVTEFILEKTDRWRVTGARGGEQ
jgi:hypothetical protein